MLAIILALLAACVSKIALSGFDDVGTLTALAALAMPIMLAFATVGLAGIGLILACLVSPVCPSQKHNGCFPGFYALYHQITDQIIANLAFAGIYARSWLVRHGSAANASVRPPQPIVEGLSTQSNSRHVITPIKTIQKTGTGGTRIAGLPRSGKTRVHGMARDTRANPTFTKGK